MTETVNHPLHYNEHPSGVECIEITRTMSFSAGNCFKYIFRAGSKGKELEDYKKALWYLEDTAINNIDAFLHELDSSQRKIASVVDAEPDAVRRKMFACFIDGLWYRMLKNLLEEKINALRNELPQD